MPKSPTAKPRRRNFQETRGREAGVTMNARWTVVGKGRYRTWTLETPDGHTLAKLYAGKPHCSYLVHGEHEALFNNTSTQLSTHKRLLVAALRERYEMLAAVFA